MYCGKCGSKLPQGSDFCPYCMNKLVPEKKAEPLGEKKISGGKKAAIISAAAIVVVIAVVCALVLPGRLNKDRKPDIEPSKSETGSSSELSETSTLSQTESSAVTGSASETQTAASETTASTTKKTTAAPKTEPDKAEIKMWYRKIINNYAAAASYEGAEYMYYYLYDMNNDGIKELLIDSDDEGFNVDVYSYKKGGSYALGSVIMHDSKFMIPKDGKGLLQCYGRMGACAVSKLTVSNNGIEETTLESRETDDYDTLYAKYASGDLRANPITSLAALEAM